MGGDSGEHFPPWRSTEAGGHSKPESGAQWLLGQCYRLKGAVTRSSHRLGKCGMASSRQALLQSAFPWPWPFEATPKKAASSQSSRESSSPSLGSWGLQSGLKTAYSSESLLCVTDQRELSPLSAPTPTPPPPPHEPRPVVREQLSRQAAGGSRGRQSPIPGVSGLNVEGSGHTHGLLPNSCAKVDVPCQTPSRFPPAPPLCFVPKHLPSHCLMMNSALIWVLKIRTNV